MSTLNLAALDPVLLEAARRAAQVISEADGLLITAGAGMGVDSGLPDFRGDSGFWQAYPALAKAKLRFHEIASPATFANDPALAWGSYGHPFQGLFPAASLRTRAVETCERAMAPST